MTKKVIKPGSGTNNPAGRPPKSKKGKTKPVLFTASAEAQEVLSKLPAGTQGGGVKSDFISRAIIEKWDRETGKK